MISNYLYFLIDDGKLKCLLGQGDFAERLKKGRVISTLEDAQNLFEEVYKEHKDNYMIMCSSSIDFVEEETDNEETINLVRKLFQ